MASLIRKLEEKNLEQERTIESLQSKCNALSKSSKQSQSPISVFETEPLDLTAPETEETVCVEAPVSPCSRLRSASTSSLDCDAHIRVSTISAISGLTDTSSMRDSFFARESFLSSRDSISGIRDSQSTTVTEATEVTDISVLGCIPEVDEQDIISRSSNSTNNSKNDHVPEILTVLPGGSGSLDVSNDIIDVSSLSLNEKAAEFVPSPTLKYLSSDIYPTAETLDNYTPVVDTILTTLSQHESQLQYRNSIVTFLQKQVRCSLGVNSFDITLHKLHCALPDDAVKVSIVINKQDASQWYKPVLERLNQAAERNGAATFDDPALVNVMELINPASTSELGNALKSVVLPHTLCNVQLTTSKSSHRINCLVDSLPAEITTNNRVDLIFLAFFEDLDGLVGQNHLFKRSVLLIRAWWHYESSAYLNMAVKHHIVDNALCVMIAAVFNIYHSILTSPLQVLLIFLQEYCQYNGTMHAITLQGLVPFKEGGASNQPDLVQPAPDHLIQSPLIEKYFRIANVNLAGNAHAFDLAGEEMASCSPHYQAMVQRQLLLQQQQKAALQVTSGETEAVTATDDAQQQSPVQKPLTRGKKHAPILPPVTSVTATLITTFERLDFNIVSPWEHTNMMVTAQESGSLAFKLSSNAVMRLHKVFTTGYTNLSAILRQSTQSVSPTAADKTSTPATPIPHCQELNSFFPTVLARFGTDWRPDAINNSIEPDANMSLTTNKQQRYSYLELMSSCASQSLLWQNVLYCNLVLESVLTESALLTLSCEILADKGPLPVGEIGKMLSEITTFPHFTTKLKEMFGGLKKFLENFPHVIFISLDHPFNPNVLLRSSVSPEQFALIEQGLLPIQNVIKSRKAALTAAAAVNTQTKKVQSRAHMQHHGGMDSMGGMGEYDMGMYNTGGYRGGPQPHMHYTPNKQQQYMGHQQQQMQQTNGYNSRTPMPTRGAHQHGRGFQQQHGYSPVSHPAHAQLSHQQMMLSQAEALLRARNSLTGGRDLSGVQGMQQYDPRDLNDDGAAMYYSYNQNQQQSQSQGAAHQSLHQHHHGKQQSMSAHEYSDHHFGHPHLPSLHISEQPYDDYHYDEKLLGSALGGLGSGLGGLDDDVLSLSSYAATRGSLGSEFGTGRNSEYGRNSDFGTGRSSQGSASDFALGPSRGSLSSLSDYPQQQSQSLSPHNLLGGRQQQVSPLASPPPVTSMMSALRENTVELVSGFGGSSGLGGLHSSNPNPLNGLGGLHSAGAGNAASQDQEEEFRPRERSRNTSVDYTPPAHHHNSLFSRLAASTSRFY